MFPRCFQFSPESMPIKRRNMVYWHHHTVYLGRIYVCISPKIWARNNQNMPYWTGPGTPTPDPQTYYRTCGTPHQAKLFGKSRALLYFPFPAMRPLSVHMEIKRLPALAAMLLLQCPTII